MSPRVCASAAISPPRGPGRLLRDQRGVSTLEFALTMPAFVIIIGGMVMLSQALGAVQNAAEVASTVGDLTGQMSSVTPADLTDEFAVASIMMAPLPTDTLSIRITDAQPIMSGTTVTGAQVGWCKAYGQGLPCLAKGSQIVSYPNGASPPLGMLTSASSSFVVAEVAYTYTPPPPASFGGGVKIYKVKFLSPRTTSEVLCPAC